MTKKTPIPILNKLFEEVIAYEQFYGKALSHAEKFRVEMTTNDYAEYLDTLPKDKPRRAPITFLNIEVIPHCSETKIVERA